MKPTAVELMPALQLAEPTHPFFWNFQVEDHSRKAAPHADARDGGFIGVAVPSGGRARCVVHVDLRLRLDRVSSPVRVTSQGEVRDGVPPPDGV